MKKQAKPAKPATSSERIEKKKRAHDKGREPSTRETYPGPGRN